MKFNLKFNMDNAIFQDDKDEEIERILKVVGETIRENQFQKQGIIKDLFGNLIGAWEITGK